MEKSGGLLSSGNKKVPDFLPRLPDEPPGRPMLRTGIGRIGCSGHAAWSIGAAPRDSRGGRGRWRSSLC